MVVIFVMRIKVGILERELKKNIYYSSNGRYEKHH